MSQLETIAVPDRPKLSVTKKMPGIGGAARFVPRDFKKLSLGQQQSVLLALMMTSESRAPLIVHQPEAVFDWPGSGKLGSCCGLTVTASSVRDVTSRWMIRGLWAVARLAIERLVRSIGSV
nr:hypothetical protein [Novosphingobium flavum]